MPGTVFDTSTGAPSRVSEGFATQRSDATQVGAQVNTAEKGNKVLRERVPNFELANGKRASVLIMGAFEIENGKIQAWRDYFDLATFASQMA
jgi:limonene-1,2-epoxide hydrolase